MTSPDIPPQAITDAEPTAMCECSHHWRMHAESGYTARNRVCHGTTGSATPGPYKPCNCRGFAPWAGPRDARTGEPARPLTMAIDARVDRPVEPRPEDVPPQAYTAFGEAIQAYEPEAMALIVKSPAALLQVLLEAGRRAVAAAAPAIRATERERRAASLIGYRIGGQVYHPEDVTIVYQEQP